MVEHPGEAMDSAHRTRQWIVLMATVSNARGGRHRHGRASHRSGPGERCRGKLGPRLSGRGVGARRPHGDGDDPCQSHGDPAGRRPGPGGGWWRVHWLPRPHVVVTAVSEIYHRRPTRGPPQDRSGQHGSVTLRRCSAMAASSSSVVLARRGSSRRPSCSTPRAARGRPRRTCRRRASATRRHNFGRPRAGGWRLDRSGNARVGRTVRPVLQLLVLGRQHAGRQDVAPPRTAERRPSARRRRWVRRATSGQASSAIQPRDQRLDGQPLPLPHRRPDRLPPRWPTAGRW